MQEIQQLHEVLEARKAELVGHMKQLIQTWRKNLAAQKDEVEMVHTQLVSCLSFMRESLMTGSQGEIMKLKEAVLKQIKGMVDNFKPDMLPPCEHANVKFIPSPDLTEACQQFGRVCLHQSSPKKSYATGRGLEVAEVGEKAIAVLHVVDEVGKACTAPVEILTSELVSNSTHKKVECLIKKSYINQYVISYQATNRGRHQLHIKVEGMHIKGSPFPVTVIKKFDTPIKIISGLKGPWGVAVNQRGEVIVGESGGHCVSIFSSTGEKLQIIGSQGSERGQIGGIRGLAVDGYCNVFVTDISNYRIKKFTPDGKCIAVIGRKGNKRLQFRVPRGIAIHPHNKKVYIIDSSNHRIQILNPDLTFSSSFGSRGSDNGKFNSPLNVAFDSTGNVYVVDGFNHRIQVFTTEGVYLRKFGQYSKDNGGLHVPTDICIDSDNVVYVTQYLNYRVSVFTCEGKFLTSFGSKGSGPGQLNGPRGIAVDKDAILYISDTENDRLQIF